MGRHAVARGIRSDTRRYQRRASDTNGHQSATRLARVRRRGGRSRRRGGDAPTQLVIWSIHWCLFLLVQWSIRQLVHSSIRPLTPDFGSLVHSSVFPSVHWSISRRRRLLNALPFCFEPLLSSNKKSSSTSSGASCVANFENFERHISQTKLLFTSIHF